MSFKNWRYHTHCVKSVQIRSYFWSVFSCIRIEYRKVRTRNNSVFGQFSRSDCNTLTGAQIKIKFELFRILKVININIHQKLVKSWWQINFVRQSFPLHKKIVVGIKYRDFAILLITNLWIFCWFSLQNEIPEKSPVLILYSRK